MTATIEILPVTPVSFDERHGDIKTHSGQWFDYDNPTVNLGDIAHALAFTCRYGGHIPVFYSVAEHSLVVSHQLERVYGDSALALSGLLHDAHEAYIGDVVGPFKSRLNREGDDAIAFHERRIDTVIEATFRLTVPLNDPRIKHIDRQTCAWEMAFVRPATWRTESDKREVERAFRVRVHLLGRAS